MEKHHKQGEKKTSVSENVKNSNTIMDHWALRRTNIVSWNNYIKSVSEWSPLSYDPFSYLSEHIR